MLDSGISDHLSSFLQPGTRESTAVTVEPSNIGNDICLLHSCNFVYSNRGFINPAVIPTSMTEML